MQKLLANIGIVVLMLIPMAIALPAQAVTVWDVTGSYVINVIYLGTPYPENLVLVQNGINITGTSLDLVGGGSPFTVTGGTVVGNTIDFDADQNSGPVIVHLTGTIALDGSMSGTWVDTAGGLNRSGTWTTTSGNAINDKSDKDEKGKAEGNLKLSGPNQKIEFNVSTKDDKDKGQVEYWNYDYLPDVLHYKVKVMCVNVNSNTNIARFMYQIPSGWPGLSGLYVVFSVTDGGKHGTNDLISFTATSDSVLAANLCENNTALSPLTLSKGDIKVK